MRSRFQTPPRRARAESDQACSRAGFSLLEVLLTTALLALILPFFLFVVVTFSQIWMQGVSTNFFPQHVDGVSLFLRQSFARSETAADTGDGAAGESTLPVEWARPPGFREFDEPLLMFRQIEAPALFVREGESLPNLYVYLYFDREEGLSLLWYSTHAEEIEDENDLFRTLVSPYVSNLQYCYYDEDLERWDVRDDPEEEDDAFLLPEFLKLTFEYEGETLTRDLYLPQRSADVPTF